MTPPTTAPGGPATTRPVPAPNTAPTVSACELVGAATATTSMTAAANRIRRMAFLQQGVAATTQTPSRYFWLFFFVAKAFALGDRVKKDSAVIWRPHPARPNGFVFQICVFSVASFCNFARPRGATAHNAGAAAHPG